MSAEEVCLVCGGLGSCMGRGKYPKFVITFDPANVWDTLQLMVDPRATLQRSHVPLNRDGITAEGTEEGSPVWVRQLDLRWHGL